MLVILKDRGPFNEYDPGLQCHKLSAHPDQKHWLAGSSVTQSGYARASLIINKHQCCGSGMIIPAPGSWFLSIPDPRIQQQQQKRMGMCCPIFFCSHKYGKIKMYFICWTDRVSDPDPHGSALIWVAGSGSAFKLLIQIRIQEGKNDPQK